MLTSFHIVLALSQRGQRSRLQGTAEPFSRDSEAILKGRASLVAPFRLAKDLPMAGYCNSTQAMRWSESGTCGERRRMVWREKPRWNT